jgi:hypothetical protein
MRQMMTPRTENRRSPFFEFKQNMLCAIAIREIPALPLRSPRSVMTPWAIAVKMLLEGYTHVA